MPYTEGRAAPVALRTVSPKKSVGAAVHGRQVGPKTAREGHGAGRCGQRGDTEWLRSNKATQRRVKGSGGVCNSVLFK